MTGRTPPLAEGQRIKLGSMPEDPCPVPAGTEGTVTQVQWIIDRWQVCVKWDNGSVLSMVIPPDTYEVIS